MREKMGDNKKFKKERERRKGKNKKLPRRKWPGYLRTPDLTSQI